jgi:hypothetical protein
MALVMHTSLLAAATTSLVFLPGDALKVVIATAVASAVHRANPGITAGSRSTKDKKAKQATERVSAR